VIVQVRDPDDQTIVHGWLDMSNRTFCGRNCGSWHVLAGFTVNCPDCIRRRDGPASLCPAGRHPLTQNCDCSG
jgi:hypothetical protein